MTTKTPDIRSIARETARAANARWYSLTTSQEPCEQHEFIADAVSVAVLQQLYADIPGDDGREFIQSYVDDFAAQTPTTTPTESESIPEIGWKSAYSTAENRLREVEHERNRLRLAMRMIRRQIKTAAPWPGEGGINGQEGG